MFQVQQAQQGLDRDRRATKPGGEVWLPGVMKRSSSRSASTVASSADRRRTAAGSSLSQAGGGGAATQSTTSSFGARKEPTAHPATPPPSSESIFAAQRLTRARVLQDEVISQRALGLGSLPSDPALRLRAPSRGRRRPGLRVLPGDSEPEQPPAHLVRLPGPVDAARGRRDPGPSAPPALAGRAAPWADGRLPGPHRRGAAGRDRPVRASASRRRTGRQSHGEAATKWCNAW